MFSVLAPIILPSTRSICPLLAAVRPVMSSGRELPTANRVRAITASDTPRDLAISTPESRRNLAPSKKETFSTLAKHAKSLVLCRQSAPPGYAAEMLTGAIVTTPFCSRVLFCGIDCHKGVYPCPEVGCPFFRQLGPGCLVGIGMILIYS